MAAFLGRIADPARRKDCQAVLAIMKRVTKAKPKMWGTSIVGFGDYHFKYESGREGDWFLTGFSPRKQDLTLYVMGGFGPHAALLRKLGKYKTGGGCLYLKRLAAIDIGVLQKLIAAGVKHAQDIHRKRTLEAQA